MYCIVCSHAPRCIWFFVVMGLRRRADRIEHLLSELTPGVHGPGPVEGIGTTQRAMRFWVRAPGSIAHELPKPKFTRRQEGYLAEVVGDGSAQGVQRGNQTINQ